VRLLKEKLGALENKKSNILGLALSLAALGYIFTVPFAAITITPAVFISHNKSRGQYEQLLVNTGAEFNRSFFYMSIIGAEIGAFINTGECLAQHPEFGSYGFNYVDQLAKNLEGQNGIIGLGNTVLETAHQAVSPDAGRLINDLILLPSL